MHACMHTRYCMNKLYFHQHVHIYIYTLYIVICFIFEHEYIVYEQLLTGGLELNCSYPNQNQNQKPTFRACFEKQSSDIHKSCKQKRVW